MTEGTAPPWEAPTVELTERNGSTVVTVGGDTGAAPVGPGTETAPVADAAAGLAPA